MYSPLGASQASLSGERSAFSCSVANTWNRTQPTEKVTDCAAGCAAGVVQARGLYRRGKVGGAEAGHPHPGAGGRHARVVVLVEPLQGADRYPAVVLAAELAEGKQQRGLHRPCCQDRLLIGIQHVRRTRRGSQKQRREDWARLSSRLSKHPVLQLTHTSWNTIARVSAAPT